jgi:hypothetical protein
MSSRPADLHGRFKHRYGGTPLHLAAHLAGFAIAAFAIVQLLSQKHWINWLGWFLAAAILHDLVLLPLYSTIDRLGHRTVHRAHRTVPLINHIRVPALISGVLLLIYFPLILGPADRSYLGATGHHPSGYLRNWLAITAALFAGSAIIYAIRLWARRG